MSSGTPITVTVSGINGSGKTAVSMLIQEALMKHGIAATVEDQDGPLPPVGTLQGRINSMKERRTPVHIKQQTLARGSSRG